MAFSRHLDTLIFKIFLLGANHGIFVTFEKLSPLNIYSVPPSMVIG